MDAMPSIDPTLTTLVGMLLVHVEHLRRRIDDAERRDRR